MRIGIFGAGAIGCHLGGCLAAAGDEVTLLGRPRLAEAVARHGLTVVDLGGASRTIAKDRVRVVVDASELRACEAVLVTVKSRDTRAAGEALGEHLPGRRPVVGFQNGIGNADALAAAAPAHEVLAGMVSFNVRWEDDATFRRATSGPLAMAIGSPAAQALAERLRAAGFDVLEHPDMLGVQWGKLLLNLNNAVNALSGLPLAEQLRSRDYRRVTAAAIDEGLAACRAAGISPRRLGRMIPQVASKVLRLPDLAFRIVARPMLRVDPQARSSMYEDLERGRPTEVGELNGEIVRLGTRVGVPTPVNAHLVALVRRASDEGGGSPQLAAASLWPDDER